LCFRKGFFVDLTVKIAVPGRLGDPPKRAKSVKNTMPAVPANLSDNEFRAFFKKNTTNMLFHGLPDCLIFAPSITETMKVFFYTKKQYLMSIANAVVCRMLSAPFRMCR
jgi:hypothetical protein